MIFYENGLPYRAVWKSVFSQLHEVNMMFLIL